MRNYQKLEAWKAAMQLIKNVYELTRNYPKEELFGLTSQTKRAAVSIAANIAEGMGRQYKKDTIQFLHISKGLVYELETLLNIAGMVQIIEEAKFKKLIPFIDNTIKLLNGFIKYMVSADLK